MVVHVVPLERVVPVKLHFGIITKAKTPVVQVLPVPTGAERVTAMTESVAASDELHHLPLQIAVSGVRQSVTTAMSVVIVLARNHSHE